MTETTSLPPNPSPSSPSPWPRPVRRRDDRVLAGVCAAAARATGTDPVLWRVLVAVLTVFGGSGLVLYAAGWLLIPEEGESESLGERTVRTRGANLGPVAVVALVVVAAVVLGADVRHGGGLVPLAVVGIVAYLVFRSRQAPAGPSASPTPVGTPTSPEPTPSAQPAAPPTSPYSGDTNPHGSGPTPAACPPPPEGEQHPLLALPPCSWSRSTPGRPGVPSDP